MNIFNHLDITVFIHETMVSKGASKLHEAIALGTQPDKYLNIVGFEVTPRSVPTEMAC